MATVLSVAMMLEWFDTPGTRQGGALIRTAVAETLASPENRTRELGGSLGTAAMGDLLAGRIAGS